MSTAPTSDPATIDPPRKTPGQKPKAPTHPTGDDGYETKPEHTEEFEGPDAE